VTPRAFGHSFLSEKISGLEGVGFVGSPENHPVAEIQRQDSGLVIAQWRDKRGGGLGGGDDGCAGFANHIHDVVVAGAVLTRDHESLRLVRLQNDEIVVDAPRFLFVEPAQGMIVEQQFQKRIDVTAFGLEFLRHRDADDASVVHMRHAEGAIRLQQTFATSVVRKYWRKLPMVSRTPPSCSSG